MQSSPQKINVEPKPFDVATVLQAIRLDLARAAGQRQLWLEVECDPQLSTLPVTGDERRLRDVLLYLGTNAIRFTKEGGICVGAKLLSLDAECANLRFEVVDTGVGIPPQFLPDVFGPASDVHRAGATHASPEQLHLAACRRLVQRMGGTIGVHSAPGNGSIFWIELKLRRAPTGSHGAGPLPAATPTGATVGAMAPTRVPVIDKQIGLKYAAGRTDLYDRVLTRFRELHTTDSDTLARALAEEDRKTVQRLLHSLKGVAAMIGALGLRDEAARLEGRYLAGASNEDIAQDLAELESQLEAVAVAIDALRVELQRELQEREPRH